MDKEREKDEALEAFLNNTRPKGGAKAHFERLERLFPRSGGEEEKPDFDALRQRIVSQAAPRKKTVLTGPWRLPVLAAAATLLVAVAWFVTSGRAVPEAHSIPIAQIEKKMEAENYHRSVGIFYRKGTNVASSLSGKSLQVRATKISALFSFEPNETVKSLTVEAGKIRVEVVGTRFIVDADGAAAFVAVDTGVVKVTVGDKSYLVRAGQRLVLNSAQNSAKVSKIPADQKNIFSNIINPEKDWPQIPGAPVKPVSQKPELSEPRIVTLTLKNGTTVKGRLISEDAASVRVKVTAVGDDDLVFPKADIAERH